MTEQRNDKHDAALEALYRETGDVEPDAGLDRIIRVRADESSRSGRSSNRLPWLGGLVTASVAIVAVAVVLQQAPPGSPPPESFAPQTSGESETSGLEILMAPSVGADSTLESSAETRRARSQIREMSSAGADESDASPPPSAAALRPPVQSLPEQQRTERLGDIVTEQAANVAEPVAPKLHATAADPDTVLARIKALLEDGEIQRAREVLEGLKREYPEHDIPEEIETALRKESGDGRR